ncbi:MAG: signal peptidase I [Oscillospiraceae bacterium]
MVIKKVLNFVSIVVVVLVVALAVLLVGVKFLGFQVFSVLSGSMEPKYPVGSLIYVRKTDVTEIHSGDVITFVLDNDTVATHRVTDILYDENSMPCFKTKGDANNDWDAGIVNSRNVIGKPIITIPYLGYVAQFFQQTTVRYVAVFAGVILIAAAFLPDIIFKNKNDNSNNDKSHCR